MAEETMTDEAYLKSIIRDVPDFPIPGILFRDITPLLADRRGFRTAIDRLCEPYRNRAIDAIVAVEARGYILASAMSYVLGTGFVPVRKPGKLPATVIKQEYSLEYGSNVLEIHADALRKGERVLVVDDVIATGGSARATATLVEQLGAVVDSFAFLVELEFLNGRGLLPGYDIHAVLKY